jgi:hypothetical protein
LRGRLASPEWQAGSLRSIASTSSGSVRPEHGPHNRSGSWRMRLSREAYQATRRQPPDFWPASTIHCKGVSMTHQPSGRATTGEPLPSSPAGVGATRAALASSVVS